MKESAVIPRWVYLEGRALSRPRVDRALRRAMCSAAARDSIIERRSARSTWIAMLAKRAEGPLKRTQP